MDMKTTFGALLLLLCLIGCSTQKASQDALQGNWKTTSPKNAGMDASQYILSFQDTACLYMSPYAVYSSYHFKNDTLSIKEPTYTGGKEPNWSEASDYTFKVVTLNTETLELQPLSDPAKDLLTFTGKPSSGTIRFEKLPVLDNTRPFKGLAFRSSICFGACPAMYVEIAADGSFTFFGERYTQKEGWYTGKLSTTDLHTVIELVQSIPLANLQPEYKAHYTDAATRSVLIESGGKTYSTSVYGSSKEPVALRILFGTLLKMYEHTPMTAQPDAVNGLAYPEFYAP